MAERTVTPLPPEQPTPGDDVRDRIALRAALKGKLNCIGDVTLVADGVATTTTITSQIITAQSLIVLMPTNAAAATEHGLGIQIVPTNGSAVLTHTASVSARTFVYGVFG